MSGISELFVQPETLPYDAYGAIQLVFLTAVYGYVLYKASNMIADGSEMLTLILSPGLVGGLILPVMGAVPDGAIVLFSGLGPKAEAQEQLLVGVGTLAGSTIMLLTIPWGLCHLAARIDLTQGVAKYTRSARKLKFGFSPTQTGVGTTSEVPRNAIIMLITALTYLIIQGPAFKDEKDVSDANDSSIAHSEKYWALAGFILACLLFVGYSCYQVINASALEQQAKKMEESRKRAFERDLHVSVASILFERLNGSGQSHAHESLLYGNFDSEARNRARPILKQLFDHADFDRSGLIEKLELRFLLKEAMRLDHITKVDTGDIEDLFHRYDIDNDGAISFEEFEDMFYSWLQTYYSNVNSGSSSSAGPTLVPGASASLNRSHTSRRKSFEAAKQTLLDEEEEVEEEEEEEEASPLTSRQILFKATFLMLVGVSVVVIFSDPMVDVLSELGKRMHIPAFYVSFIVTPLVSNASEFISSLVFAKKRTKDSITMTFSALLGAATMNNTFGLAIFLALVYFRGLAWKFSAEVLSILLIQIIVGALAIRTKNQPTWHAYLILALFPMSIAFVAILENVAGLN